MRIRPEHPKIRNSATVLMLGSSLESRGGVASVVRVYQLGGLFARWPITYLATHLEGGAARKVILAFRAWLTFGRWLVRRQKFVLHVHGASRASFWRKSAFILPASWSGRSVIFHLHGGEFIQFYEQECGPIAKRVVRYVLGRCTRIVVLSESWRTAMAGVTRNQAVEVIFNPAMPFDGARRPIERDPRTLLFLGRIERKKGIYVLFDAIKAVLELHADVRLMCAGNGDLDEARRTVIQLGLEDHVEILGWVGETRRAELLGVASIFVLPSFAEGLPMSILEAMSAGLPVVATAVGGIPEVISDGVEGLLVPVDDAQALTDAICRLIGDSSLRCTMASRARTRFDSSFSVDAVLPKVESMYRELGVEERRLT